MFSACNGKGYNPYAVNFITFSGHGITFKGDSIAVIAEYERGEKREVLKKYFRFINFSHWARKFATVKNTISIFLLSMCRIVVD
jgi:hypothetical protein